jgi:hypothetical protein
VAALTWTSLQTQLQAEIARTPYPYATVDGAFATLFPASTQYAENYIYNKIPMLAQRTQDTSLSTTGGSRSISLKGTPLPIVVPERIALLTPTGSTLATGTQVPFLPASLDFIDLFWPTQALTWPPSAALATYWCIEGGVASDFSSPTVIIAPTPDAAYTIILTGLFQQKPISATNPQTYLSTVYPQLFAACCMLFISGALLRNYGSASDEPGQAVSWQQQVDRLIEVAAEEEGRRKQSGTDWLYRAPVSAPQGGPPAARGAA